jgi:phospholipase C
MMENHSFDNYFGMLPRRGQAHADGFTFDAHGRPTNTNPTKGGYIRSFRMPSACQPESEPNQSWDGTHTAIARGKMNGFVTASGDTAMGYWDDRDLPFYYGLAKHFTLANRWFCSAPCQTYPNRRYLMAATSWGLVSTVVPGPNDPPPPHGTIFDRLNAHGVSWKNYFTDLPQTALIPSVAKHNPSHYAPIAAFSADCAAGTLPNVSFVDPDFGMTDVIGGRVPGQPIPTSVRAQGQDEENPQNIRFGEAFVAGVVNAVMRSPAWRRTLLVWLYDEHGGYYDHVPPPAAVPPDSIKPILGSEHARGGFDVYGPRVPAVVVSPWSRPRAVTNVVHDHTSILKFIEQKWNLPAITYRDANAHGLQDFLDFSRPRLLEPPALPQPADPIRADAYCDTSYPVRPVQKHP